MAISTRGCRRRCAHVWTSCSARARLGRPGLPRSAKSAAGALPGTSSATEGSPSLSAEPSNSSRRSRFAGLEDAGLPHLFSPHSFRVAVVTDLLNQNVPLKDVQYLAGHSNPRTTQIYDRRRGALRAISSSAFRFEITNGAPRQAKTGAAA